MWTKARNWIRSWEIDEKLVEWFALTVLFAAGPLILQMLFRWFHSQMVWSAATNIPELTFLTVMVNITAAGNIKEVVGEKVADPKVSALFWFLLFGAFISGALLAVYIWDEVTVSEAASTAATTFAGMLNSGSHDIIHNSKLADAARTLQIAVANKDVADAVHARVLRVSWWLTGAFLVVGTLSEMFLARARGIEAKKKHPPKAGTA